VLGEPAVAVPLVVVASTTAGELELGPDFGQFTAPVRLYLPDETWFDTVSTLIAVADRVIVWAAELSPGVARELRALTAAGRTDATLVVLDPSLSDPVPGAVLPRTGGEPLTGEHPALAAFGHVVDVDELDVPGSPPLARVLDRLDAARRVPLEQRVARLPARQAGCSTCAGRRDRPNRSANRSGAPSTNPPHGSSSPAWRTLSRLGR
jgi:hypothetical protein